MDDREKLRHALFHMGRLHHRWMHSMAEKFGLYPGQPQILHALTHREGASQVELAQGARVRPPTMAVMLRRMEAAGLIERCGDPQDARVQRVYLTDKGRDVQRRTDVAFERVGAEMFVGFSDEELRTFLALMEKLNRNLASKNDQEDLCENCSDI